MFFRASYSIEHLLIVKKNKKQECWTSRNFLFGKGTLYTNFSITVRLFLIFCLAIIVLVSPVVHILNPKRERKCILRYKSTSSNSVLSLRDNLRFLSGFLRWIALYVPDRLAATFYMLKVRGCACGVIKIGKEEKKNLRLRLL